MMTKDRFAKRMAKQREAMILDAALACFNERGCFLINLDRVVAAVGVGKGTLYRHYGSREELFNAALRGGIQALLARCRDIQGTHAKDPDAGLCAVISDLVSLNQRDDPASPATLARLRCSCRWMNGSHPDDGKLEFALMPVVRIWQAAELFDRATDPSWIAAVMAALIGSAVVTGGDNNQGMEQSGSHASPREPAHTADIVSRIIDVLDRAFRPTARSRTA